MFANGAAQLEDLELGLKPGTGTVTDWDGNGASAWVTLVDLSDEILCSLCVRGSTVGGEGG